MTDISSLRDALIERWFDPENDDPETITDEQIIARIEDLVGEGWYHAGKESERLDLRLQAFRTTAWEHLIQTDDEGYTSSGYSQEDIPDELLIDAIVDAS